MTRVDLSPLAWLDDVERQRRAAGLRRSLRTRPAVGAELDLASNDYLGLSRHPAVIEGGVEALRTWGAGSTGSRLVTGNTELHEGFESALADFVGAESALVFSSGYTANLGAVVALSGPGSLLVSDALTHASLVDACRLSRARVVVTPHRDVDAVDAALRARDEERAVVLDRLGVQRRRRAGSAARAARRVPTARRAADRRRGARPRRARRRRPRPAARSRPGRGARRRDDDDAVQGAGQPGWRGARPDRGARSPDRRGATVHLRHRPGASGRRRGVGGASRADRRTVAGGRGAAARGDACRGVRRRRDARLGGGVGDPRRARGGAGRGDRLPGPRGPGGLLPAADRARGDVAAAAHRPRLADRRRAGRGASTFWRKSLATARA